MKRPEIKKAGISNLEVTLPEDGNYSRIFEIAEAEGMDVTSFGAKLSAGDEDSYNRFMQAIEAAGKYEVGVIFTSAKLARGASHELGIEWLKELGAAAAEAETVISLETHPPFAHCASAVIETLDRVDSAGVGFNYDTANIYFYNEKGIDSVAELRKAADYVTSVHLKESAAGEPEAFDFPVFGEGIVPFREVFNVLSEAGFRGPYTIELEGKVVYGLSTEQQNKKLKECLDHLEAVGAI